MDASLNKRTKLSESFTLDFRAGAFNRPQFGTARSLHFMVRLSFQEARPPTGKPGRN